jgi:hypothetical protein
MRFYDYHFDDIPVTVDDGTINDPEFARLCAEGLLALIRR